MPYDTIHVKYFEMAIDEHLHSLGKIIIRTTNAAILHGFFKFFYRYKAILEKKDYT